ncbi:MAG: hypothetical protein L6408_08825 [Nanoarchaeota archaeon]|nr:hypothetical protein [Nanoarchaeota archaeon]
MKKRGQATAFVLVGAVIVILVTLGIFFRAELVDTLMDLNLLKEAELPEEAQDVKEFIVQCIKETSTEGIELLGLQGGYIDLPKDEIPAGNINKFSNKLEFLPGFRTAYWYYRKDNGLSVQDIPTNQEMGESLRKYIDSAIPGCLDEFSTFPDYYNIQFRTPQSKVDIQDDAVIITLNMPLQMDIKEEKFNYQSYKTSINVALGDLMDIARQIVENEMASNFLEDKTIDMMVAYDEIPYSGSDLSCGTKTWQVGQVITAFKQILFENIAQIRVKFTDYDLTRESQSYFEWPVTKKRYDDVNVLLQYSESWPFYMDVDPKDGGVLKSQQVTDRMGDVSFLAKAIFCMNDWNFVYDVRYPVMVTLYDAKNDYTLQFAMQVVIERNQPREATIMPDEAPEKDRDYCKFTKVAESTIYTYEEDINGISHSLEGVDVKYGCINHICDIGTTEMQDGDAMLTELFPSCVGGTVIGEKEGYAKAREVEIDSNQEFSTSLILEKIISKPIKIQVSRTGGGSGMPTSEEQVIIEFEEPDKEYSTMIIYPDQKEVKLIPGTYNIKSYIIKSGPPIKISGRNVESCVDKPKSGIMGFLGSTEQECTTIKLPDIEVANMVTGGSEYEWDVFKKDLYISDYVKFYIQSEATPTSVEDFANVNLEQEVLLPVFLNE